MSKQYIPKTSRSTVADTIERTTQVCSCGGSGSKVTVNKYGVEEIVTCDKCKGSGLIDTTQKKR